MAGIRKQKKSGKHQAWFKDSTGKRRWFYSTESPKKTLERALRLEEEHRQIRLGHRPEPSPSNKYRNAPFETIRDKYLAWGDAQGGRGGFGWSRVHARVRRNYLEFWKEKLNLETLRDLENTLEPVEETLSQLLRKNLAPKTAWEHVSALKVFIEWCIRRGYMQDNPLKRIQSIDTAPRTRRRAMTASEIKRVLEVCNPSQKLLFETAFSSGLRAGELSALRVKHMDLNKGGFWLEARWTKNRKGGFQPVPRPLLRRLAESVDMNNPEYPLLEVPSHPGRELEKALTAAKIPKETAEGKLDFHAARTAYITALFETGANLKEIQTLARHSTPTLTANVYARTREERLAAVTESLNQRLFPEEVCAAGVPSNEKAHEMLEAISNNDKHSACAEMVEAAGVAPASLYDQKGANYMLSPASNTHRNPLAERARYDSATNVISL